MFGHSFGLDQTSWRHIVPAFEAHYRVITFDYVGSGQSDRTAYSEDRYATLDGYAQDVLDILGALDIERCVFVGASISGMIGLIASLRAPTRISQLIMIGSSSCYIDDPPSYRGGFSNQDIASLLELLDQNFVGWAANMASTAIKEPDIAIELERGICAIDPRVARAFASAAFYCDLRAQLPLCKQPVLVVQCEHDDIVPDSAAEYLAKHLPHGRYKLLRASSHCPQLTHPAELRRLISEFLNSRLES